MIDINIFFQMRMSQIDLLPFSEVQRSNSFPYLKN